MFRKFEANKDFGYEGRTVTSLLQSYCNLHLREGQPRLFDELYSQRNYAMVIARGDYARPSVYWEPDRQGFITSSSAFS